ncbi:MAG: alpha/beta fold hydrolase [Gemmataceae bacterium]
MFALSMLLPAAEPPLESLFVKAGPNPFVVGRTPGQTRAIVLIHGLSLHLFSREKIVQARPRTWQAATSPLVHRLAREGDVYAFAYSQTAPVERIAERTELVRHIRRLVQEGYREIVLIGHSAGGLIARQLVEDHPDCGVTRVVQVNAPNAGSPWAALKVSREAQTAFFASLSVAAREKWLNQRRETVLPATVQFACVVGNLRLGGDGVVSCRSQWTEDLQRQGVPAFALPLGHRETITTPKGIELLGQLVTGPLPRWDAAKIKATREHLLGR